MAQSLGRIGRQVIDIIKAMFCEERVDQFVIED